MASDLSGWLSTGEAARYAGVSRQRVDQLIRGGVLDAQRLAGRLLVRRSGVDVWMAARVRPSGWRPRDLHELRFKRQEILDLAARHRLGRVRVFGSVARGEAGRSSDVDLLVGSLRGASALDVAEFATDIEELLGCRVDVVVDSGEGAALDAIRSSAVAL
jgi:hypothetical protein